MNSPPTLNDSQAMLAKLIQFDTTSHKSNLQLIDFVRDYLKNFNIDSQLIYNKDGDKANLFATIGENKDGGILLSGHTDVVPVKGQDWHSDPFEMIEKDGKLIGRGTCDMKGFIASVLTQIPKMVETPLSRPIHLAFSFDEEVSCLGVPLLTAELGKSLPMPDIVIVGEPTMMKVVSAHKGILSLKITAHGFETHSSMTHIGVSAVMNLARIVNHLHEMGIKAQLRAKELEDAKHFTPPYTTIHSGIFNGGTAGNIISKHAECLVDIRFLPDDDPMMILQDLQNWIDEHIIPDMKAKHEDTGIEIEVLSHTKGLAYDANSAAEQFVRAITGDNETNFASYATEAGIFQRMGPAVVICGPGAIDQAHQPNEFLAKDQLQQCDEFLGKVIEKIR